MFFYASKIIAPFLQPSSLVMLVLVAATAMILSGWRVVWGKRLLAMAVAVIVITSASPFGNWIVLPLEERFTRGELPDDVSGILILGGFEVTGISRTRGGLEINEAAERLTEGVLLARRLPRARLVFTGGEGTLIPRHGSAAGNVGAFLEAVGIEPGRIVLESNSRTTYENALFLREMLKPRSGERYVLVTSAFHMPRAVGTFRRHGFDVVPWPVDYRTRGPQDALEWTASVSGGLERADFVVKEWLGLLAYRLTGRTDALFPGPIPPMP